MPKSRKARSPSRRRASPKRKSPKRKSPTKRHLKGGIDVSKCLNDADPISLEGLENLRDSNSVQVFDPTTGKLWCFSRASVCEAIQSDAFDKNPLTNVPWTDVQKRQIFLQVPVKILTYFDLRITCQHANNVDESTSTKAHRKLESAMKDLFTSVKFRPGGSVKRVNRHHLDQVALRTLNRKLALEFTNRRNEVSVERFYATRDVGRTPFFALDLEFYPNGFTMIVDCSIKFIMHAPPTPGNMRRVIQETARNLMLPKTITVDGKTFTVLVEENWKQDWVETQEVC